MPKKKKNGHSALAGQAEENVSAQSNPGPNGAAAVTRDLSGPERTMSGLSLQSRDEIVRSMHDMFSHLDPDVIYIVLSEADFKVENAMDALLELSGAASGKTTVSPLLSGFEMAAALLEPSQTESPPISSVESVVSSYEKSQQDLTGETELTDELDSLIDHELESLTMRQPLPYTASESVPVACAAPLLAQEAFVELDQLDVDIASKSWSLNDQSFDSRAKLIGAKRNASPITALSSGRVSLTQETGVSVDFSHLTQDSTSAAPRPSAFKAYRRPDVFPKQTSAAVPQSQSLHTFWNIHAPHFKPYPAGPTFITPVVRAPNPWTATPMSQAQWMPSRPASQAPLKPSATVPKSWILAPQNRLKLEGQVLVLLRGAPGSGKTTLASAMLEQNPGGAVLSTDEYFTRNGAYHYEPHLLGEGHAWNHRRAKEAFEKGRTPIIIDNTNLQCWEMKPYVALAQKHSYRVLFREPNTWWKTKPRELEKRTKHGVTKEKIRRMLENQDRYVSVANIMTSQPQPTATYGVDVCQTDTSVRPLSSCPDLVGGPEFGKPGSCLSSSLPDVSSVDCKSSSPLENTEAAESLESVGSNTPEGVADQSEAVQRKLVDGTDMKLDLCMTRTLEQHAVCAESIGQRVKRVREQTRTEVIDVSTPSCDSSMTAGQDDSVDSCTGGVNLNTENIEFVGDWPSESLEQRRQRSRKSASQTSKSEEMPNPTNKTEFQKLLDLLQGDDNQAAQETALDFLPLAEDRDQSGLVAKPLPILPDCVLDWTSEISGDPEKGNSHTPSPIREFDAGEDGSSTRCAKEACADDHTPANRLMDLRISGASEQKHKPDSNSYLSLSSGGELDCSSECSPGKRRVSSRRAGKTCKLALTFTQQSPSSSPHAGFLLSPLQQSELSTPPCPSVYAQTEPQDFALLWRINQQKCSEQESESSTRGLVVLEGNPLGFIPKPHEEKPSKPQAVPYRVCHEKGSQVEENDLTELLFKHHSLEIISRHFKHVPKETLEDLYEKCCQDIEWTTNLLLDSGERLSRDDEENQFDDQSQVEGHTLVQGVNEGACDRQVTREHQVNCTKDVGIEEAGGNYCEGPAISGPNNTNSAMSFVVGESIQRLEHQPEETSQMEHSSKPVGENEALRDASELPPDSEASEMYPHEELAGEVPIETPEVLETIMRPQIKDMEVVKEELRQESEQEKRRQRKNGPMSIQTLELKLTTELALQLTELFGPVGISPGEFSPENCSVLMDLNLAKLLHQKWKDTIQEKHRQAALSYHLQEGSEHWSESQPDAALSDFLIGTDALLGHQSGFQEGFPFMDHWNVSRPPVSLRDIMLEEQVLQDSLEKSRVSRWDLDKKDGAAVVKEKQLFALFPTIDRHFLRDIFRDNNYSLEQTELFLRTLIDDEPVRTVVASEYGPDNSEKCRGTSKDRKQKNDIDSAQFQDIEDPEYEDFRTEATLQRRRQQECFDKAAEAYRQGRKDVASFYAQQGHLHGQKMKEANHRAAVQIFERVNSTLLPQNILDLHGLHVNEALHHLQRVLAKKTSEWQQSLCRPQLSVITGRGNRSQGGVARIRPAVLDYLKSQHYKYTEPKLGLVIVMLHRTDY